MIHLTVIAKSPEPGRVKTRLCPPCTLQEAAEVAAAALDDTLGAVDATVADLAWRGRVRRVLLLDGPTEPSWVSNGYDVVAQRGHGLGVRLANGFHELGPGVIVAMDAPAAGRWLGEALRVVERGGDVLGLAGDGGYWAIGLATTDDRVFEGVAMGRSNTGLSQLRRLHQLGRSVRLLPMARDLDDVDDLRAYADAGAPGRLTAVARRIVERLDRPPAS